MATGGGAEEESQRGRPQLPLPARPVARVEEPEGGVRHLPGAFFLGAERGYSWYKGQPKTCFKCGSRTHMSGTCTQDRCFRCGEEGHLSPYCRKVIVCNLCGKRGHAFAQCPKAVHNSVTAQLTSVAGH